MLVKVLRLVFGTVFVEVKNLVVVEVVVLGAGEMVTMGVLVDITVQVSKTVRNAVVDPTELFETVPIEVEQISTKSRVVTEHSAECRQRAKAIETCGKLRSFMATEFEDAACEEKGK